MSELVMGIDEAGRGAVIGPLVIAGAAIEKERLHEVEGLGVKDSKDLSVAQRERMYAELKQMLDDFIVLKVSAYEIDTTRERINLNQIEAEKMAKIIDALEPKKAIVDAPEANTERFQKYLFSLLKKENGELEIVAENKADERYPICSAASIIAKVERDWAIEKIKNETGVDFGVGYPHDEKTRKYLKELAAKGEYPPFVRRSWATADTIRKDGQQRNLGDY